MISFTSYFYKEEGSPVVIFSIHAYRFEDTWTQRYIGDMPLFTPEKMERGKARNLARCKYFRIALNLCNYHIHIDFKYKHVGNIYYGRQMYDSPRSESRKMRLGNHE